MAGLVPAIPMRRARCLPERDARAKPAHDETESTAALQFPSHTLPISLSTSFAALKASRPAGMPQ
jgi:hypothetical protein